MAKHTLAIDADNFLIAHRENMTAYITGKCEYDYNEFLFIALEELTAEEWESLHELVRSEFNYDAYSGSHEEWSTLLTTPNMYVHERNGIFRDGEEEAALHDLNALNIYDWNRYIISIDSRIRNIERGNPLGLGIEDPQDLEFERAKAVMRIKRYEQNRELRYGPAYLTLGIYLTQLPDPDILALIKSRAESYAAMKGFNITGYRLITERVLTTSEPI